MVVDKSSTFSLASILAVVRGRPRVPTEPIGRRSFLVRAGRRAFGVAVLGVAGCAADDEVGDAGAPARSGAAAGLAWSRVDLAYVSADVLVRGREAAIVDTGAQGSADRIGEVLEAAGSGWDRVRDVVVPHADFDHVGSLGEIADRRPTPDCTPARKTSVG